jgi:hypothetical protein
MAEAGLTEVNHLEAWIKAHPEVIDDSLMVVTTQFASWASKTESARERPDVLALSSSGGLVVIELKRDGDRRIHLQALTYGALAAGFTKEVLAQAHADWLSREQGQSVTKEAALDLLTKHVESEWREELFQWPRLVLVAESFPAQVLTTVQWLANVAPQISIECHEYQLFREAGGLVASFQRLFPVEDPGSRRLLPTMAAAITEAREQLVTNQRRAKSVTIIFEQGLIPEGAALTLDLAGLVRAEVAEHVDAWMAGDPKRQDVTWARDSVRPLVWACAPGQTWTPSALRNEIFAQAGAVSTAFSAADAWCYEGEPLYVIASRAIDGA